MLGKLEQCQAEGGHTFISGEEVRALHQEGLEIGPLFCTTYEDDNERGDEQAKSRRRRHSREDIVDSQKAT